MINYDISNTIVLTTRTTKCFTPTCNRRDRARCARMMLSAAPSSLVGDSSCRIEKNNILILNQLTYWDLYKMADTLQNIFSNALRRKQPTNGNKVFQTRGHAPAYRRRRPKTSKEKTVKFYFQMHILVAIFLYLITILNCSSSLLLKFLWIWYPVYMNFLTFVTWCNTVNTVDIDGLVLDDMSDNIMAADVLAT